MRGLLPAIFLSLVLPGSAEEEKFTVESLIAEGIKVNKKWTAESIKEIESEDSDNVEEIVKLEKEASKNWDLMLKYALEAKDEKIVSLILRNELNGQLLSAYYDLEYAEGAAETILAKTQIAKYKKRIAALDEVLKKHAAKGAKVEKAQ